MSLQLNFAESKEITVRTVKTVKIESIKIERIVDIPEQKKVLVFAGDLGQISLDSLSDANYNNPPWTDEMIAQAVKIQLGVQ